MMLLACTEAPAPQPTSHPLSTLGLNLVSIACLHPQPDDENYSLALDFCLQKAYYHSFADVNPRQTEEFYAE